VAAAGGGLGSAAAGWLLCAALCLVGWVTDTSLPLSAPLRLSASLFALVNGGVAHVAGLPVSIIPLGMTVVVVTLGVGIVRLTLRHGFAAAPGATTRRVAEVAGVVAAAYLVAGLIAAAASQTDVTVRGAVGGAVVGGLIGWIATAPLFGWRLLPSRAVPGWVLALPRALGAGLGLLLAGASVVLTAALISSHDRIAALQAGLQGGAVGGAVLTIAQLMWIVNLVIWCAAWLTGGGIALGVDTVISPVAVHLGMLPSVPVFGAVPPNGAPPSAMVSWFIVPVLAGAVAAWVTVRAQATADRLRGETPRPDIGALVGGATGLVLGAATTLLAALSRGDLGLVRMVGLGPRLGPTAMLATTLMGLAGMVAGAVVAWRLAKPAMPATSVPGAEPPPPTPPPTPRAPKVPPKPPEQSELPIQPPRPPRPPTPPRPPAGKSHAA